MNNVEIQDGVTLINCLLCSGCVIKKGTVLKEARVTYAETVGEDTDQVISKERRQSLFIAQ